MRAPAAASTIAGARSDGETASVGPWVKRPDSITGLRAISSGLCAALCYYSDSVKPAQLAQLVVVAIAAIAVYSFGRTVRDAEARRVCTPLCAVQPNYAGINRLAPDFELETVAGGKKKLSSYRGKVVILNFWTKTCRPCLDEMDELAELAVLLRPHRNIALVTVSTDESVDDVRGTLRSVIGTDNAFPVLVDPGGEIVSGKYGTKLFPETWFIDRDGVIRARVDGARSEGALSWNSAVTLDFAESLLDPNKCPIAFARGTPRGELANVCADFDGEG
jgi:peroxiredoxin